VHELFRSPSQDILHMHRFHDGALLTAVELPSGAGRRSHFLKYTMRNVWDFALASIAVSWQPCSRTSGWRVVLGGVAATPWRLPHVEQMLEGSALDDASIKAAAVRAADGAKPLSHNSYKVPLVTKLVEQALREARA